MKKLNPLNPYTKPWNVSEGEIGEVVVNTPKVVNHHAEEIEKLQEKVETLEKINEVNAYENQELKNEINELKEHMEQLREEIKKLTEKQAESELIAVIQQAPPAYNN